MPKIKNKRVYVQCGNKTRDPAGGTSNVAATALEIGHSLTLNKSQDVIYK